MKGCLPLFRFTPTICWLDDDELFLSAIEIKFNHHYHCKVFKAPLDALEFFSSFKSPLSNITFKQDLIESELYGISNHFPVDIDINHITNLITLTDKSKEIAVLVVDFHMPDMNGLEICKKLKALPFKKILLTGEATQSDAILAFNEGVIDRFIRKDEFMGEMLEMYIADLVNDFFITKTENIISHFEASKPTLFTDNIFIDFFKTWCVQNNIVEYYLLNKEGSFLTKNKAGQIKYMVVMSDNDRLEFLKLTDELFDDFEELLETIKEGKKIPFFGPGTEYWQITPETWEACFYEACPLVSPRTTYYWTVIPA